MTHPERQPDPLLDPVRSKIGVDYLYPYQRLVISNTLEADPELSAQMVVLPTGSGKTLCFLLPALLLPGLTIVVYPLLALMDDQLRRMQAAGIAAEILRGGQARAERDRILAGARSGSVRCLIANPEVLAGERVRDELSRARVSHLVIDEAHCVSEWGSTFRPAYLTLADTIERLEPAVTTAFTATASPPVLEAVSGLIFGSRRPHLIVGNPDRANIAYYTIPALSKHLALRLLISAGLRLPAIVFCRSRKRVEGVARELAATLGWDRVGAYHAGLEKDERAQIEAWFFKADDAVLVATCAYGMGVDKANVRSVVHFDLPPNVESFLQESGRGGRDGAPATSVVLWNQGDARDALATERGAIIWRYLQETRCRRAFLLSALGAESDSCFGCDSCEDANDRRGPVLETAHGLEGLADRAVTFVHRYRRLVGTAQLEDYLRTDCTEPERADAVEELILRGRIRRIRRGPWRSRLTDR